MFREVLSLCYVQVLRLSDVYCVVCRDLACALCSFVDRVADLNGLVSLYVCSLMSLCYVQAVSTRHELHSEEFLNGP